MKKPSIAIKKSDTDYEGLIRLGNAVTTAMTLNGNFATPVPAVATLQTAVTDVENALSLWGDRHNHGSKAVLTDLRQKSVTLKNLLKAMSQYVEVTAQLAAGADYAVMASIIDTSGFSRKADNEPVGVLQAVLSFRHVISRNLLRNQVKLNWKKPENSGPGRNVNSYLVMRSATQDFNTAVQVAAVTKTTYLDSNTSNAPVTWSYWIIPVNAAGPGVVSDDVTVTVLGA